jgi:hypothetical protein
VSKLQPFARIVIDPVVQRAIAGVLAFASMSACAKDSSRPPRAVSTHASAARVNDSAAGAIDLGGSTYRAVKLTAVGSVIGTIRSANTSSSDASEPTTTAAATPACAAKRVGRAATSRHDFANTIVWIADVKSGKPMPVEKRADLSSEDCLLDPVVQGVVVGTTMNIINDDKVLHKLVFTKLGTHDTLVVTPFFNAGQMVTSERVAKSSGIVEVRCVQHPWTRGYIAVFDHPYFAVTEGNGTFKIDSLPPGSYKLMVWRDGDAKPAEQSIQVPAGGVARVDMK